MLMDSPPTTAGSAPPFDGAQSPLLASRRSRLFAQLAEFVMALIGGGLFGVVLGVPLILASGPLSPGLMAGIAWVSGILWVALNAVLLARRGQTLEAIS